MLSLHTIPWKRKGMKQRKEERETNVCMCAHMYTCNRRKENWIEERTATGTIRRDEMRYDAEELHCIARCIAFVSIDTSLECISLHCIGSFGPTLTDCCTLHCIALYALSLSLLYLCVFVCVCVLLVNCHHVK